MAPTDEAPMPRIGSVSAAGNLRVRVTWTRGVREGVTEEVDLAPIINSQKYFRPLRSNPQLFASVHPIVYGAAIAWGEEDDIDLSADAILRTAIESMTGEDLRAFIKQQDLTETALAAILGYSRRQIVGFINEARPIPRVVSLACRYIELVNPSADSDVKPQQATEPSLTLGYAAHANLSFAEGMQFTADLSKLPPISFTSAYSSTSHLTPALLQTITKPQLRNAA